jgi:hypothetical protein
MSLTQRQRLLDLRTPVALFCRFPGEPYIFLGRLRHVSSDMGARPLRFLWELLDADRMAAMDTYLSIVGWGK